MKKRIAVIGAGPAGIMAAIKASENSENKVTLIERNSELGKKLKITGGGRCNITNNTDIENFYANIVKNPRFMMSAFSLFDNDSLKNFLDENNIKVKVETENNQKVYLANENPQNLTDMFLKKLLENNVDILFSHFCEDIEVDGNGKFKIALCKSSKEHKSIYADSVICATGGYSYPTTGSDGNMTGIIKKLGHSYSAILPALSSITVDDNALTENPGVSIKVTLSYKHKRNSFSETDDIVITHRGISGPCALDLSSHITELIQKNKLPDVYMDLIPHTKREEIVKAIKSSNKTNTAVFFEKYLPKKLVHSIFRKYDSENGTDISNKNLEELSNREVDDILSSLKNRKLNIKSLSGIETSIVTRGGVKVKEINPSTMESKIVPGLFFCGEIMDIDAVTGGFNLQIAFSSGYTAGVNV